MPTLTLTLREDDREIHLSQPGRYLPSAHGIRRCEQRETIDIAPSALLVHYIGDFASAGYVGDRCDYEILVNERPPLGRLQLLQEGDVIRITPTTDRAGGHPQPSRFICVRQPPPIRFVLPASSLVRCAYTVRRLAGATAVRCPGCFRLYHETAAWESELLSVCPACGWSAQEPRP
jgi:hypothetical protein